MDIARAVEQIYKDASYRKCHTYAELLATWKDARPIPTKVQLADAWVIVLQSDMELELDKAAHEERVVILHDDVALGNMTYDQRVDLMTNIMRVTHPQT